MASRSKLTSLLVAILAALVLYISQPGVGLIIPGVHKPKNPRPRPRITQKELRLELYRNCPQKGGIVTKVTTMSPKKPNSAIRKICKVKLTSGVEIIGYIPGEGHSLQEFSSVMIRGGKRHDLVGVKYTLMRGVRDLPGVVGRKKSRSLYGVERPEKK
eukprot:TRINITY_DN8562_c0_g1_i3.p1 TRINITY_DN8562_c0_g1~~TRINITY_DN8562_c0_g1_i3.p1  ORF type:complete len:158 (-),score=25.79 TRINITY_DN8562_c0_g1_i3:73-546(-)